MARKQQPTEPKRATLQMPRPEAEARIRKQIEKGQELLELRIGNSAELEQARNEKRKWSDFNAELLRRIVDTDELVNDYYYYNETSGWHYSAHHEPTALFSAVV